MEVFVQLSVILVIATVISSLMRLFKQPLVIGYILTGLLISPYLHKFPDSAFTLESFSNLGITILLFIVGLHLSPKEVKDFGKSAFKIGSLQILFTFLFGLAFVKFLGYELTASLYLAIAVTFSSTIIVLKILSDEDDLEKFYGRIVIGILLLQDLIAGLLLIAISSASQSQGISIGLLEPLLKGILLTVFLVYFMTQIFSRLSGFFAKSKELLFLFSISFGFGIASLFHVLGLSIEIGALVAGVALSMSTYSVEISNRLKPLRDFFVITFYILIGSRLDLNAISNNWLSGVLIVAFVLLIKPIIIMILMGFVGNYKKRPSFMASVSLAQVSEFSLIIGLLGYKSGHINSDVMAIISFVAVVSIVFSAYFMSYSRHIFARISGFLSFFERKSSNKVSDNTRKYDVILFGCNRVGFDFVEIFKHMGSNFLCVDYDPDLVSALMKMEVNCKYGDAEDAEFLKEIGVSSANMLISTIPDFEVNDFLLSQIKNKDKVIVVLLSTTIDQALSLYEKGADYVILPFHLGGRFVADMINNMGTDIAKIRDSHIKYLTKRKSSNSLF